MTRQTVLNSAFICSLLFLIYLTSFYSFLLFHSIVEIFSILIAGSVFLFAWNSRKYFEDGYFLFLGITYLFVGSIDFVHAISYKGIGIFSGFDANLPTQLWIAARYMESLSLVFAFRYFRYELRHNTVLMIYVMITSTIFISIFGLDIFPDCYVEGRGLTSFKVYSEYIISAVLVAGIFLLRRHRHRFDHRVYWLLVSSISLTVVAELAFTFYISVFGLSNLVGHFCKIVSFYLVYKAIIETGVKKPYNLLFRELKQNENQLKLSENNLKKANSELMAEIAERKQIERKLQAEKLLTDMAINAQKDTFYLFDLASGEAVRWNRSFSRLTGYSDDEIKKIKSPDQYFDDKELVNVHQTTKEVLETGASSIVLNLIKKDGETVPMEFSVSLMNLLDSNRNYFLAVGRDITKRLENEEQIKASLQLKETLLHEVHHRVKNNLAVISSLLSLQARQASSSEAGEILKDSKNRIQAMARIHETLYKAEDVSLIEMQDYLLLLVRSVFNSFGNLAGRVGFSVEAEGINLNVGQATTLGLIVNELVTNTLKYAFPDDRKGSFSVQLTQDGDQGYQLRVFDNGVGFPGEIELSSAESLGLTLVRLLTENQLHGTVEVNKSQGVEFNIRFGIEEKAFSGDT